MIKKLSAPIKKLREPINGLTHLIGVILALVAFWALLQAALKYGTKWHVISFSVFGVSLIALYTASTLYHSLPLTEDGLRMFRRIDHIMIFVLIAGSYTPFCLVPLRGTLGWTMFSLIWGIALGGIALKIWWLDAPQWLSLSIYIGMGWFAAVAIYPLAMAMPLAAFVWLIAGGVIYTIGAVLYGIKWPNPIPNVFGSHEIWHIFVLGGSFCHFCSVYYYLTYL